MDQFAAFMVSDTAAVIAVIWLSLWTVKVIIWAKELQFQLTYMAVRAAHEGRDFSRAHMAHVFATYLTGMSLLALVGLPFVLWVDHVHFFSGEDRDLLRVEADIIYEEHFR